MRLERNNYTIKLMIGSEPQSICPYSGLPIESHPHWTRIPLTASTWVTFRKFGNLILDTYTEGERNLETQRVYEQTREQIIQEAFPNHQPYVEMYDLSGFTSIPSAEVRRRHSAYSSSDRYAQCQARFVYGGSRLIRTLYKVGMTLIKKDLHYPVIMAKNFQDAIVDATAFQHKHMDQQTSLHSAIPPNENISISHQDMDNFIKMLGDLAWEQDQPHAETQFPEGHPLHHAAEAYRLIRDDYRSILKRHQQAETTAQSANHAKSIFLANMSHEIRTPLNGVVGMLQLLLECSQPEDQRQYTEIAQSSADSLLVLINDILDLSKIESGKLQLEHIPFEFNRLMDQITSTLGSRAQQKGLQYLCTVDPLIPNQLIGDPGRIRQILNNLVGNAIKFTLQGEISVMVSLVDNSLSKTMLRFEVRDSGIGIQSEVQQDIFEAFQQADPSISRLFGGTGLGLAISKQLVQSMGGDIGVQSIPGQGSTFWFRIALDNTMLNKAQPTHNALLKSKRCLLAVQQSSLTHLLERLLNLQGIETQHQSIAQNIMDALLLNKRFDMVILDHTLPDSEFLIQAIRQEMRLSKLKLILIHELDFKGDWQKLKNMGVDRFLTKPIQQSHLTQILNESFATNESLSDPQTQTPNPSEQALSDQPLRILVVEDNPVNQKVSLLMLKKLGYSADLACDGEQALQSIQKNTYDLILMDCQMPVKDGYETTRQIRALPKGSPNQQTPIVAMTANAMEGDRNKCLDCGMNDFIEKPVKMERLQQTLRRWSKTSA